MDNKTLYKGWCFYVTKLVVYSDRVEIGRFFGLNKTTIPTKKINTVSKNILQQITITTQGGEDYTVLLWRIWGGELYSVLLTLID